MALRRSKVTKATMNALFATPPLDYEAEFDEVRAGYPNQIGRLDALDSYLRDRNELGAEAPRRVKAAMVNYLAFLKRPDQDWRHAMNLKTFFNNWRDWESEATPTAKREQSREEMIRERAVSVAAFISAEGDPDKSVIARARFETWAASFVRESDEGRWRRWCNAAHDLGIDPRGGA